MDTTSHWQKTAALPKFPQITHEHEVDVVIVGGGLTGLTAAYLFKKAGYTVAVLERGRCGGFDTANTTAHLTHVTDTPLHKLAQEFGSEAAWLVWEGGRAAIEQIYNISRTEGIACFVVAGLHAFGLHCGLERRRKNLGLPVPRLAFCANGRSIDRPGGRAVGKSQAAEGMNFKKALPPGDCR